MAQQQESQEKGTSSRDIGLQRGEREQRGSERGGIQRRDFWGGEMMSPSSSSPFGMMRRFFDDLDRLLGIGTFGQGSGMRLDPFGENGWMPAIEILEQGENMVLRADLPGCKREDIQIRIHEGRLVLTGERRSRSESEKEGLIHSERSYGRFMRSLSLPSDIDEKAITANYRDGMLEIVIPRPAKSSGRQIEIGEASSSSTKH